MLFRSYVQAQAQGLGVRWRIGRHLGGALSREDQAGWSRSRAGLALEPPAFRVSIVGDDRTLRAGLSHLDVVRGRMVKASCHSPLMASRAGRLVERKRPRLVSPERGFCFWGFSPPPQLPLRPPCGHASPPKRDFLCQREGRFMKRCIPCFGRNVTPHAPFAPVECC